MNIREIHENKKQFLPLLLLADEQENMIDRYLERGTMYVLEDGGVKAECVVTDEGGGILELKNLAVEPEAQGNDLVHQGELGVLELLADVFFNSFRIVPDKFDIKHGFYRTFPCFT